MKRLCWGLLVLFAAAIPVTVTPAGAGPAEPADFAAADFSGYSTGSAVHADALQGSTEGPRVGDADVAFSGAAVASKGFATPIHSELAQAVLPTAQLGRKAYGRGTGVEAGTGTSLPNDPDRHQFVVAGLAEAAAPPSSPLVTKELTPVSAPPLVYASLVRGQAQPVYGDETCVLGQPISYGLGYAADVQLGNGGPAAPDGSFTRPTLAADVGDPTDRTVSQSKSLTYLIPNGDGTFGLASETRQTLAPVTLFKGTANELTIEVLGEFVFRAVATGKPGGARIDYAPDGSPTPTAPVVRLLRPGSPPAEVTFEQLFGPKGFTTPANPFVSLALGEDPRQIAGPGRGADPNSVPDLAGAGTSAAGAVDVVRLTLPNPAPADAPRALEVRIGHMEARATVPPGGIRCRIPVRKATDPDLVLAGQPFTWTISIPPRPDSLLGLACDLIGVSAVDTSSADTGVDYTLESASSGGAVNGRTVTWPNLGNYHPGDPPILVTISGRVSPTSLGGILTDTVDVTAALGLCTGGAGGKQLVGIAHVDTTAVTGAASLVGPRANVVAGAREAAGQLAPQAAAAPVGVLPRTGDDQRRRVAAAGVLLGFSAVAARRRRTRRT
jgi:hypothetical protein